MEGKQKFIGQIMTSKSPVRSAEDIDVQRLKLLKANHLSQRYALEDQIIKQFPQDIATYEQLIEGYAALRLAIRLRRVLSVFC